jgi:hypothetical protein
MSKTSILAETLAEIQEIKEGIEKNANHVLRSTLKEDLEAIVRKGLNEAEEDIQPDDMVGDGNPTDQDSVVVNPEEMPSDETGIDPTSGIEPGEPEVIDLTDEPFDKVVDTFERMQLTDEIEIVKTPEGGIQINIEPEGGAAIGGEEPTIDEPMMGGDDQVIGADETGIEMGGEEPTINEPGSEEDEMGGEDDETIKEENEVVYEIEIAEEAPVTETAEEEVKETVEETAEGTETQEESNEMEEDVKHVTAKAHMKHNTEELHESLVATRKKLQALVAENKIKTQELEKVTALVEEFKSVESDYKSAIKNLKGQLQEVALFTSNLTYAVKLMTENSTTKDEKLDILKRFDSAKTLSESREVYNSLETLFTSSKNTVEKTIEERVLETPKASGAANLNESTAYKNPQLERMLDIIGKIK